MSKPDWKDAPEWAQYLAQDYDGAWWWYEREPAVSYTMGYFFAENGGEWEEASYASDWDSTLEQRPCE